MRTTPVAVTLALVALAVLLAPPARATDAHAPIAVTSDAQLDALATSEGWPGNGTDANPYVLQDKLIAATSAHAIDLSGTTRSLLLARVTVTSGGAARDGIRLVNVRNVNVVSATIENARNAIFVQGSYAIAIQSSTAKSSGVGLFLKDTNGAVIADNKLALNDHDVEIANGHGNSLQRNDLSIATGQFGVWFDDAISYDNAMDTTNVVNAQPLRWSSGLTGSAGSRASLDAPTADLKGATNVAQVIVADAKNVTVSGASARSGAALGILCLRCDNVTFTDATAEGNAANGIQVDNGRNVGFSRAIVRNNGGSGLLFTASPQGRVDDSTIESNGHEGVRATASADGLRLARDTIDANRAGGFVVDGSAAPQITSSTLFDDSGADVALTNAPGAYVSQNTIRGASPVGLQLTATSAGVDNNTIRGHASGIKLTRSTGSTLATNTIEIASGQTALFFDDEASYDNSILPSNRVNGQSIVWIAYARGTVDAPLVVPSLAVDVPGITNVAQIMVYRSANVTLPAPAARNGSAAGILLFESERVRLDAPSVSGNAQDGISLRSTPYVRVSAGESRANAGHGVRALNSASLTLENVVAQSNRGRGISVETSDAPTLRGNAVIANVRSGVYLDHDGPNGATVDNNLVQGNTAGGVFVDSSPIASLRANNVTANADTGIQLTAVPGGAVVAGNAVTNHTSGIRLAVSNGSTFSDNVVTILSGQKGFFFEDETSYDNAIAPTNLVNGVPMRWIVRAVGSTLSDARVELRGITNVAQVLVYRSSGVTLDAPIARNGTDRGIYVYRSANVTVSGARVVDNSQQGIHVELSPDVLVQDALVDRSGREGLSAIGAARIAWVNVTARNGSASGGSIAGSDGARIQSSRFEDNADTGLTARGSNSLGLRIEDSTIRANRGGGAYFDAINVSLIARNTFTDNVDVGLGLNALDAGAIVRDNVIVGHARSIRLSGGNSVDFQRNAITTTTDGVGFAFLDRGSAMQNIDATNTVSGVPMRWVYLARGTIDAPLVLANWSVQGPKMTNLAQAALIGVANVTLDAPRVANGAASGLLVLSSENVTLRGAIVRDAGANGISLEGSRDLALVDSLVSGSAANGVSSHLDARVRVLNSTLRSNGANGFSDDGTSGGLLVNGTLADSNRGSGIVLTTSNVGANATITNDTLRQNGEDGLTVRGMLALVRDNTATQNGGSGIFLSGTGAGTVVHANTLRDQPKGIRFANAQYADVAWNNVTIQNGQFGLYFDDETSFNNVIALTNLVNGATVRWYTTITGAEDALASLPNVSVELRGITNVAQVMVYRSSYVRIPGLVATNGTGRGLYLYRSSNVLVEGPDLSGNRWGAHLHQTQSSTLRNVTARGTAEGVRLTSSLANTIARVDASGATIGVEIADTDSRNNVVYQIETNSVDARSVVDPSAAPTATRGANLVVDAGAPKSAKSGILVNFTDALSTTRYDTERIATQSWSYGDGASAPGGGGSALRPSHAYGAAGTYRATFTITTIDAQALSDDVSVTILPPLGAPIAPTTMRGDRNVTLLWTPPTETGSVPILKYRVYGGLLEPLPLVADVANDTTRFVQAGLQNGVLYKFQVTAVTVDGEGPRSVLVFGKPAAAPSAPLRLVALPNATRVDLSWSPPADDGGAALTGYRVLRANASGGLTALADLGNVTAFRDANVTPAQSYRYALQALNAVGAGNVSVPMNATLAANDTLPPVVILRSPDDGARITDPRPLIEASFVDNTGVVLDGARLELDGLLLDATFTPDHASYRVPFDLAPGGHVVRLVIRDAAGNAANVTWSFSLPGGDAPPRPTPPANLTTPGNSTADANATNATPSPANDTATIVAPPAKPVNRSYGDVTGAAPAKGKQKIPAGPVALVALAAVALMLRRRR